MPQITTVQNQRQEGLPTSDYTFGLDQLYANAEAVRNQRRRNIQAVEAAKRALAAKGLSGDVQIDDMGKATINATKESLTKYFGTPTLTDEMTSDAALYGFKRDDNSFSKKGAVNVTRQGHTDDALRVANTSIQQATSPLQVNAFNAITNRGAELASGGVIPSLPLRLPSLTMSPLPLPPVPTTAPVGQIPLQSAQNPIVPNLLGTPTQPQQMMKTQQMQRAGQSASANYEASTELPYLKSVEDKDTIITEQTLGAQFKDFMPYDMGTLLGNQAMVDMASIAGNDPTGQQMNVYNDMIKQKAASINAFNEAMSATINPKVSVEQGGYKIDVDKLKASVREGVMSANNTSVSSGNISGGGAKKDFVPYNLSGIDVDFDSKSGMMTFQGNGKFTFDNAVNDNLSHIVEKSTKNGIRDDKLLAKNIFEELSNQNGFSKEALKDLEQSESGGKRPAIITFLDANGKSKNVRFSNGELLRPDGKPMTREETLSMIKNARGYDIKDKDATKVFFAFYPLKQNIGFNDTQWRVKARALSDITAGALKLNRQSSKEKQGNLRLQENSGEQ